MSVSTEPSILSRSLSQEEGPEVKRRKPSPKLPTPKRTKHEVVNPYVTNEKFESSEELSKQYKKYKASAKFDLNSEELFCICRKPDHGELMIACDGCEDWYHFKCMNLNSQYSKLIAKFYCKFCTWKGDGVTKWKRKCRLDRCLEPIQTNSKYCSDEHGEEYMRAQLIDRARSNYDLKKTTIKEILHYVGASHENLLKLGSEFPELTQVEDFNKTKDSSSFPQEVKDELMRINDKLGKLSDSVSSYDSRMGYLVKIKEIVKGLNDKLSDLKKNDDVKSASKKKSKAKKIDICLYDKTLNSSNDASTKPTSILEEIVTNADTESKFVEQIQSKLNDETDQDWFNEVVCIQERKKCLRHNGWWNLVNDGLGKKLNELNVLVEKAEAEREEVLRKYSIQIYENGESVNVAQSQRIKEASKGENGEHIEIPTSNATVKQEG